MADLVLKTQRIGPEGAFSYLKDLAGNQIAVTAEHTYDQPDGSQMVKVPPGRYLCVRGVHTLNGRDWFETFEITGVLGHKGILFHPGNTEFDSDGCVLTGRGFGELQVHGLLMDAVLQSRDAFNDFMALQAGVQTFWLDVDRSML